RDGNLRIIPVVTPCDRVTAAEEQEPLTKSPVVALPLMGSPGRIKSILLIRRGTHIHRMLVHRMRLPLPSTALLLLQPHYQEDVVKPLSDQDPRTVGPYRLIGRLGAGGMGTVYLGESPSQRRVAVKVLHEHLTDSTDFRQRFPREVEAVRRVSGFYTAPVVDADADAARPWLATAYVAAPSLEGLVRECGPLPVRTVHRIALGMAEALASIHSAGVTHRDVKPANVLIAWDGPRVIDFGIAHTVNLTRITPEGTLMGTLPYMAPEQLRAFDPRNQAGDVYSMASTLVFAATGHAPFDGTSVNVIVKLLEGTPDLMGLPDLLLPLIEDCMAAEPADRPAPDDLVARLSGGIPGDPRDVGAADWLPPAAVRLLNREAEENDPQSRTGSRERVNRWSLTTSTQAGMQFDRIRRFEAVAPGSMLIGNPEHWLHLTVLPKGGNHSLREEVKKEVRNLASKALQVIMEDPFPQGPQTCCEILMTALNGRLRWYVEEHGLDGAAGAVAVRSESTLATMQVGDSEMCVTWLDDDENRRLLVVDRGWTGVLELGFGAHPLGRFSDFQPRPFVVNVRRSVTAVSSSGRFPFDHAAESFLRSGNGAELLMSLVKHGDSADTDFFAYVNDGFYDRAS
ncbi:serine/threonine-protein kinase, partial [Streptomyces sp. NPDC014861]|uniref:serine/threonine-protein kinase n=1 Tax=Streptomyces sp. NPDC014861 TaxID=3364923 RepID=UPI00370185D2